MLEWLHAVHHSHREYLLVKAKHLSFPSSGRQEGWIDSCFVAMEKMSDLFSEITRTKKHLGPGDVPLTWVPFPVAHGNSLVSCLIWWVMLKACTLLR